MEKNISKAKSAEATSAIVRFLTSYPDFIDMMEQLMMCDADRLKALLKVKSIKLSKELINYIANTEDDISTINRVVKLINHFLIFNRDIKKYAHDSEKTERLLNFYDDAGISLDLKYCSPEMDILQLEQVMKGFANRLSVEEIEYYCDHTKFSASQMREIRKAYKSHIPQEDIEFMSESGFSVPQMRQLRKAFITIASETKIKSFAKVEYDASQMEHIRNVIEGHYPDEYADFINNQAFNTDRMKFIREAFESNVSLDDVKELMKLSAEEAKQKLNEIQEKRLQEMCQK